LNDALLKQRVEFLWTVDVENSKLLLRDAGVSGFCCTKRDVATQVVEHVDDLVNDDVAIFVERADQELLQDPATASRFRGFLRVRWKQSQAHDHVSRVEVRGRSISARRALEIH